MLPHPFKTCLLAFSALLCFAACTDSGRVKNPFQKEAPFVASAVPVDFAIKVSENHDTYYARQHIEQDILAADAMSRTTYTTFRDYNNTVSDKFSQETPLSPTQFQSMWNDVARYDLLHRSTPWINWLSAADLYKRNFYAVQIRANGQTRVYQQTNGFPGAVRPLMLQIEAVRLPISQDAKTRVVPGRQEPATSRPAETTSQPATLPLTPATQPATRSQAPLREGLDDLAPRGPALLQ